MSEEFEVAVNEATKENGRKWEDKVLPENASNFIQWLTDAMNKNKVSGYRLAHEIGVSVGLVSHWLKGRKSPKRVNVISLAKFFHVNYMEIEAELMKDAELAVKGEN